MRFIVIHIIHTPKLFIASRVLSSWPRVIHFMHNLELFISFRVIALQPRIVHVILGIELFIAFRGLRSWDLKSFISSRTLSCS